jgi:hypothetical protein
MSKNNSKGHAVLGFVSGITKHKALVTGSYVIGIVYFVDSVGNIRTLLFQA